ncbi:MAG: gamma-glutamyltransferase, partial [Pseudomonadota bacterium]
AALAVVEPRGSGIGGGGFWLLHRESDGFQVMIDGRERAPLAASRDMYIESGGRRSRGSLDGPLSAAIPGVPAALEHLAEHYGRLPLARSLAPAIRLAEEGFEVDPYYRRYATFRLDALRRYPSTASVFLKDNKVPPLGHRVFQPQLARTLERIAAQGAAGFYAGKVADMLVEAVRAAGGIWTREDLAAYEVVERQPVVGRYGDMRVVSAAPPSAGGIALVTMLNILELYDPENLDEVTRTHLVIEAMRHAYHDRARYLGDPDHTVVPTARLAAADNAGRKRRHIDLDRATPSATLEAAADPTGSGGDTTHFSVIDKEGNRVAATLSINYPFGSGFMVPGTGVLLNDEMDDFSARPGEPNAYGLVGAEANAIAPGKRPLSSMTPTFLEAPGRIAVLGTPGGSRIITMVLLATLEFTQGGEAASMVSLPRFHHQYLPDRVVHEGDALKGPLRDELAARGHHLEVVGSGSGRYGNMQAVVWDLENGHIEAASDPRQGGAGIVR